MGNGRQATMGEEIRYPGQTGDRVLRPLTREQALLRLRRVPMGRVAFSSRAMPAIRPVNHIVDDDGMIIIRSNEGGTIVTATDAARGSVVSFEADCIDNENRTGWTVMVTGLARIIDDPVRADEYRQELHTWVSGMDYILSIDPAIVRAFELVPGHDDAPDHLPA